MCYLIKNLASKLDWTSRYNDDYALSISNLIIEQQISFRAAITIKKRFQNLVKNLDYNQILNLENDKIQKIGFKYTKNYVDAINELCEKFKNKEIKNRKNNFSVKWLKKILKK